MAVETRETPAENSQRRRSQQRSSLRDREKIITLALGTGAIYLGLRRGGLLGLAAGALGTLLTYRGLTHARARPLHFVTGVTIDRPPEELYQFWHGFTNLPRFMKSIRNIQPIGDDRTHWVAAPAGAGEIEWDAEVVDDIPNEQIGWRTVEGSDIHHQGRIRFHPAPAGRGTEVELEVRYEPVGSTLAGAMGRYLNTVTEAAAREDLRRFKRLMESGEIPTGSITH
ncbi:MAG: SRPBCC family protein [Aquisalimonadaceae bacterium]